MNLFGYNELEMILTFPERNILKDPGSVGLVVGIWNFRGEKAVYM